MFTLRSIFVLLSLLLHPAELIASERAGLGREIAIQWCTSCHVVVEGQVTAFTAIPTFREIARKYNDKQGALEAFLTAPQHPMPEVNLSRDEVRNLSAYIMSLE